jgi:hypothetical protein
MNLEGQLDRTFYDLGISPERQKSLRGYLEMVKQKHPPTHDHLIRTAITGVQVARYTNGLVEENAIFYPGLLHDVGKIKTDVAILDKKVGFNDKDREALSKHPIDSHEILKDEYAFSAVVDLFHHYFQGERSYPKMSRHALRSLVSGKAKNFSNETWSTALFCARLVSLVDFYDAATTRENDYFSPGTPRHLSSDEAKQFILKSNPDKATFINNLYKVGIFK